MDKNSKLTIDSFTSNFALNNKSYGNMNYSKLITTPKRDKKVNASTNLKTNFSTLKNRKPTNLKQLKFPSRNLSNSLNFPYIQSEKNHFKTKQMISNNVFSLTEATSNKTERSRMNNISNFKSIISQNNEPQLMSFNKKNSKVLIVKKMSKLIQFKSMSQELNEKHRLKDSKIAIRHNKIPKFSSDLMFESKSMKSIKKSKDYKDKQNYIHLSNNGIYIPKLTISSYSKNNTIQESTKETALSKNTLKLNITKDKPGKITRRLSNSKNTQNNKNEKQNDIGKKKDNKIILNKYIIKEESKANKKLSKSKGKIDDTALFNKVIIENSVARKKKNSPLTIDSIRKKDKENKILQSIKLIQSIIPKREININPFPSFRETLSKYEKSFKTNTKKDRQISLFMEADNYKMLQYSQNEHLLKYQRPEILYFLDKYFYFYQELADEVVFGSSHKLDVDVFTNLKRKLPKSNANYTKLFNENNLNTNNHAYMEKFIKKEYEQSFNSNNTLVIDKISEKKNTIPHCKRRSASKRVQSVLSMNSDTFRNNIVKNRNTTNNFYLKFAISSNKIKNFNFSKIKKNLGRAKNIELKHHFKEDEIKMGDKVNMQLSINSKEYNKKEKNHLTEEKIFKKLCSYIAENKENAFENLFNAQKGKFNIEYHDKVGNTLLILAIQSYCVDISRLLLENGANPNSQNKFLNTPLHYAYSYQYFDLINLLIHYNANQHLKNRHNEIPSECVKAEREHY